VREVHSSRNLISYAAALLMLLFFALFTVAAVLCGARTFHKMQTDTELAYHERTAEVYIAAKLRRGDTSDAVFCADLDGIQALGIRELIDGETYITYIYVHDGWLTELFCPASAKLSGDAGETVVPLDSLTFEIDDEFVRYTCVNDGRSRDFRIALRAAGR